MKVSSISSLPAFDLLLCTIPLVVFLNRDTFSISGKLFWGKFFEAVSYLSKLLGYSSAILNKFPIKKHKFYTKRL